MLITRTEDATGGPNRTPREEIVPLFTGPEEVNPEQLIDCSQSEGWAWQSDPRQNTWGIQQQAVRALTEPFAALDSQAAREAGSGAGGTEMWPFCHVYLPFSDARDSEGDRIIDAGPKNFDERFAYFMSLYPQIFRNGIPVAGGTEAMEAVIASDDHFMQEFGGRPYAKRPIRGRIMHTDGELNDAEKFQHYLASATLENGFGRHGEWREAWAVAIYGESNGGGHQAYEQYLAIAETHPWVHPYYFEGVTNSQEIAEDMAIATVPTQA